MRYEQTRTILQHLAPDYHRAVANYYQDFSDDAVSPRVQLMLDYLVDHEKHRALALGEYCHDASEQVLAYWFKGIEINFPSANRDILGDESKTDLDQLVKAAVTYKKALLDYFGYLLDHCSNDVVGSLLKTLKTQEEKAMKRMIRHAQGLADL
jgi:hypothetical protein